MPRKRTVKEIKEAVENLGYVLLDEYTDKNKQRMVIIQDNLGYKYNALLSDLIKGHLPNFVDKGNPKTLENISLWLLLEKKNFVLCENNEYKRAKEKLLFYCLVNECHENFHKSWEHIYCRGLGCPYCSGKKISNRNRLSTLFEKISSEWDYELNEDSPDDFSYASNKKKFWKCPNGHRSYLSQINSRTSGRGCPECKTSGGEDAILFFLKKWDIKKEIECKFSDCRNIQPLPFDFYLPDYNLCIEYHGIQHYKPIRFSYSITQKKAEDRLRTQRQRDKIKEKYCKNNNISLLIIPYWEFKNIEEILGKTLSSLQK